MWYSVSHQIVLLGVQMRYVLAVRGGLSIGAETHGLNIGVHLLAWGLPIGLVCVGKN